MRIEITLQEDLPEGLRDRVARQIAFKLGNKPASIDGIRATIKTLKLADSEPWYECNITVKLRNQHIHRAQARGRQPNICIADAASRASRAVVREAQLTGSRLTPDGVQARQQDTPSN